MKNLIIVILCLGYSWSTAQEIADTTNNKRNINIELGVNFSYLVNQILPFANDPSKIGPYSFSFKAKTKKALIRAHLGMNLNTEDQNDYLGMAIGFEIRKPLNKSFDWYWGMDGNIFYGSFNLPNEEFGNSGGLGIGGILGMVYYANDFITISTETTLYAGLRGDTTNVLVSRMIPPLGIFVNIRL